MDDTADRLRLLARARGLDVDDDMEARELLDLLDPSRELGETLDQAASSLAQALAEFDRNPAGGTGE